MSTTPTSPNIEDMLFTDLDFLNADSTVSQSVTPTSAGNNPPDLSVTPQAITPTQTPVEPEIFLKGKVSVYKTKEEAAKSLDEKDDKIEYLRQFALKHTGVDPFKPQTIPAPQAQVDDSYVTNPKKYVEDLAKAWESQDPNAYAQVQNRLIQENLSSVLAPYLPTIQQSVRQTAIDAVSKTNKDFSAAFTETPEYKTVLEENPTLASAITAAEQRMEFKDQLPELYRIAHAMAQNKKVPELLKAAQTTTATTPQNTNPQVRPTASQTTLNPPTAISSTNWKTDPAARKAFIDRMRGGGAEALPLSMTRVQS